MEKEQIKAITQLVKSFNFTGTFNSETLSKIVEILSPHMRHLKFYFIKTSFDNIVGCFTILGCCWLFTHACMVIFKNIGN